MHLYKFGNTDLLFNVIKTHPKSEFFIYNSKIYYQNANNITGSKVSNLFNIPTGHTTLNTINIDRVSESTGRTIGPEGAIDKGLIYPFIIKGASGFSFKTTSTEDYQKTSQDTLMTSSYNLSSSITRKYISSTYNSTYQNTNASGILPQNLASDRSSALAYQQSFKTHDINTLKNSLESYTLYSPHFAVSSSIYSWNKLDQNINLISIPTIFYGSKIKKGTVELNYYITGTLVGTLTDQAENGILKQTGPVGSVGSGSIAGMVMYNHGFILLTGSWNLDETQLDYETLDKSKWIYWGTGCNDGTPVDDATTATTRMSASFSLNFKGTHKIPNHTIFATAPKANLNWSNNPTFIKKAAYPISGSGLITGSYFATETQRDIVNIVSSSISTYSASYNNTTYINHVNLYDDMGNLIAIAKTSKPIKKTEDTDFTFKLKLDM